MRFRNLRIAWSVVWGLFAVLLIVLWVRSYSCRINIQASIFASRTFQCSLLPGRMYLRSYRLITAADRNEWLPGFWQIYKNRPNAGGLDFNNWGYQSSSTFHFSLNEFRPSEVIVQLPYWAAMLVLSCVSSLPWLRWRFSLRTLLIATTLVAMVLGLAIYATSK